MVRFQNRTFVAVLSLALAALMVADAMAQRRGRGGRGFGRGGFTTSRVQLATLPEVQAALNLSDELKEQVTTIEDEMRDERRELFRGGGGDFASMREDMEKIEAEATAKLAEKLDDAQNQRLTEIYVQVNGANALSDNAVQAKLSLTEDQNKKLADAREENAQAMRDAFEDFQDMSREERQQAGEELREESNERLIAVLTDEQKSAFEAMKGEAIEVDTLQLFRRGGRGGGFGGGQRGQGGPGGGGRGSDRPARPE